MLPAQLNPAFTSFIEKLRSLPTLPRIAWDSCRDGPDCVAVTVTGVTENWDARFFHDGRVTVTGYMSEEWLFGHEGLAATLLPAGRLWLPIPERSTAKESLKSLYLRYAHALLDANLPHFVLPDRYDCQIVVVRSLDQQWEVTFEEDQGVSVECFKAFVTLEGEKALVETYEWWVREE